PDRRPCERGSFLDPVPRRDRRAVLLLQERAGRVRQGGRPDADAELSRPSDGDSARRSGGLSRLAGGIAMRAVLAVVLAVLFAARASAQLTYERIRESA